MQIKKLGSTPILKPSWITDSIELGKLLDYRRYLLYSNQSVSQPSLQFSIPHHTEQDTLQSNGTLSIKSKIPNTILGQSKGSSDKNVSTVHANVMNGNKPNQSIDYKSDLTKEKLSPYQNQENKEIVKNMDDIVMKEKIIDIAKDHVTERQANNKSKISTKTASDPTFLKEFYSNSRLHLISTLGARYKQLVNELRETSNGKFSGRNKFLVKGMYS